METNSLMNVFNNRVGVCAYFIVLGATLFVASIVAAQGPPLGTPHSVTLAWTAPSPVGGSGTVSGYNIYRAAGSGSAATLTFTKINTGLNSGVTFTDAGVAAGAPYSYCVTTVDSLGGESACSGVATANVPTNPNAPSAPLITVK